jgi:hypothetical protein
MAETTRPCLGKAIGPSYGCSCTGTAAAASVYVCLYTGGVNPAGKLSPSLAAGKSGMVSLVVSLKGAYV